MRGLLMNNESDSWKTLQQFFDNPENAEPDIKALAAVLRSDAPLPDGFCTALAEILDSRLSASLACNWQLVPKYRGFRDTSLRSDEENRIVRREIAKAQSSGRSIESAVWEIAEKAKISERKAYKLKKMQKDLDNEIDAMTQEISDSINEQARAAGVDLKNLKPPRAMVESTLRLRSLAARYNARKKGV
jgi:hypothetical protein